MCLKSILRALEEDKDVMLSNYNKKPIRVKHSELNRSDDSLFRSICPVCKDGILPVTRDPKTLQIIAGDYCLLCGQHFIYEDIETMPDGIIKT